MNFPTLVPICISRLFTARFPNFLTFINNLTPKMSYYAVRSGRNKGVYSSWSECEQNVKGYSGASYKKFSSAEAASDFVGEPASPYLEPIKGDGAHPDKFKVYWDSNKPFVAPDEIFSTFGTSGNIHNENMSSDGDMAVREALAAVYSDYILNQDKDSGSSSRGYGYGGGSSSRGYGYGGGSHRSADVYTDGACYDNGRSGARAGVGVYWGDGDRMNVSSRHHGRQTNNSAEITAASEAIRQADRRGLDHVTVNTDSEFTIKGATQWMDGWKSNGWRTASGGEVKNRADFEELDRAINESDVRVSWRHVPGHSGHHGNEMADRLANEGASKYY